MFLLFLFFLIVIKFVISDIYKDSTMKVQEFQEMERKAKTFACSLLADNPILSKKKEKQIRDYLKKNNFLKSGSDSSIHEKIKQFKTAICFNNIYSDRANDILMELSEGKYDLLQNKDNAKFFDFDKNADFAELTKDMKETNKLLEDLQKEEESLHEKRKDDPELDNSLKDIEKKMFKNPKFGSNGLDGEGLLNFNGMDLTTDREEREKKEKFKNQKTFVRRGNRGNIDDMEFNFKNLVEHPEILRKYLGIKSLIGFIIFMTIITIIDNRNKNRILEEEKKKKEKGGEENKNSGEKSTDNKNTENKNDENKNINKDETNKEKIE